MRCSDDGLATRICDRSAGGSLVRRGKWLAVLLATALAVPVALQAQQERVVAKTVGDEVRAARLIENEAKVEEIDFAQRRVRLRFDDGSVETIKVSDDVENLESVAVGDVLVIGYYQSLTLSLNKVEGAAPALSEATTALQDEQSPLPAGVRTQQVTVVAKVTKIDTAGKVVTLTGPKGRSVELEVTPEVLGKVKVGDLVNAAYTEALAVKVRVRDP